MNYLEGMNNTTWRGLMNYLEGITFSAKASILPALSHGEVFLFKNKIIDIIEIY